jgi:hypothetical protein
MQSVAGIEGADIESQPDVISVQTSVHGSGLGCRLQAMQQLRPIPTVVVMLS